MIHSAISFAFSKILAPASWLSFATVVVSLGVWQWEQYREAADQENLERLNRMVAEYRQRTGHNPDLNMIELFRVGLSDQRLHRTPYGGTYQIDPDRMMVYNPHRSAR
jgi:hypothetical protein